MVSHRMQITWVGLAACLLAFGCSTPGTADPDKGGSDAQEARSPTDTSEGLVDQRVLPDGADVEEVFPGDAAIEDTRLDQADLPDEVPDVPPDFDQGEVMEDTLLDGLEMLGEVDAETPDVGVDLPPPPCELGQPCNDGNPCTADDVCVDGFCVGTPYTCDDGRPCTMDVCDGLGNCGYSLLVGKCLVNGICAKNGELKPGDQCSMCDPLKNQFQWTPKPLLPCDDGSKCTTGDKCVGGICQGDEVVCQDDGNACTKSTCIPEIGCVQKPNNISCEDGNLCTTWDYCTGGECVGGPTVSCDDFNACTDDYCSPDKGCYHTNLDGNPCDDGNACTVDDECEDGECESGSETLHCEDWTDCTDDICDPSVGCTYPLNGNPCCVLDNNLCNDNDPCTVDSCDVNTGACLYAPNQGACSDGDLCTYSDICTGGECRGLPVNCDDKNPCTLDLCNSSVGCIHEALSGACNDNSVCTLNDWCVDGKCKGLRIDCNDYNFCTDDICDPVQGCKHAFNGAPCNDFNLCTTNDQCISGSCSGLSKNCNDNNPCTSDACVASVGCQNLFNMEPCEDGNPCTEGDSCSGGVCKSGAVVCYTCNYDFSDSSNRARSMKIAPDEKPENALDLNGDGQPDNSMAGLSGLANGPLQDSLDGGDVHLLFEHHNLKTDGNLYTLAVFIGDIAAGYESCDYTSQYCGYTAKPDGIDLEQCDSLVTFKNATIYNGVLQAGGASATFPWQIPISETTVLNIVLYRATLRATVAIQGGMIVGMNGILGGAIPKQAFIDAVNALPEEGLPLPKSMIIQMVQSMIQNDIDTNGDGAADAASIAIKFEGIPAGILGIE